MFPITILRPALLVLLAIPVITWAAGGVTDVMTAKKALERWPAEGLTSIRVEGLDILYVNPDARLDGYRKVLLKPVTVAPNLDWRLKYYVPGTTQTLNLKPMVDATMAHVHKAVAHALRQGGYALTDVAAADTVEVNASIVDIFLIAVKIKGSRVERAEGLSLGNATLVADIRDSESGKLILRTFDIEYGPAPKRNPRLAGEEAEAWLLSAVDQWAELLRKALDVSNRNRGK